MQEHQYSLPSLLQVVAAGRFCDSFKLDGLPDLLVLMSPKKEQNAKDEDTGYKYKYEYVEFAALWLNVPDTSPSAQGKAIIVNQNSDVLDSSAF